MFTFYRTGAGIMIPEDKPSSNLGSIPHSWDMLRLFLAEYGVQYFPAYLYIYMLV